MLSEEKFEEKENYKLPIQSYSTNSIEDLLREGEIELIEDYIPSVLSIKRVKIKNNGIAFLKINDLEPKSLYYARVDYEMIAKTLDKFLGFNLVPPLVKRVINGQSVILEYFLVDSKLATYFTNPDNHWSKIINSKELIKAAVFDYLIGAKNRHNGNFLVNSETGKIWLIDNDKIMFEDGKDSSLIVDQLKGQEIPEDILSRLLLLYENLNSNNVLSMGEQIDTSLLWQRIKENALLLFNYKKIL
jgi:hypothetical protein